MSLLSPVAPNPACATDDIQAVEKQAESMLGKKTGEEARQRTNVLPGWATMDRVIREYDEVKVKDYKEDIDNLLVFAGLFSSVLTAFVIESYPSLLPDTSKESLLVLQQLLAAQTANQQPQGNVQSAAVSAPSSSAFHASGLDVRVNILWFASLILTLIAAFFGILVKQWLREYMAFRNPSPQARLRVRHVRYPALAEWKVFEIAAFLPTIIHIALALFFVGLIYFTKSIHSSIEYTALPLVIAWLACFCVFTSLPFFFPRCPYHITLLREAYAWTHRFLGLCFTFAQSRITSRRTKSGSRSQDSAPDSATPTTTDKQRDRWTVWDAAAQLLGDAARAREDVDEIKITQLDAKDLEVLSEADAIQSNDQLLVTEIADAVSQVDVSKGPPHAALKFIHRLLYNRQVALPQHDHETCYGVIIDLRKTALSAKVQEAIVNLALGFLNRHPSAYVSFTDIVVSQASSRQNIGLSNSHSSNTLIPANLYVHFLFALLLCLSGYHDALSETDRERLSKRLSPPTRSFDIVAICKAVIAQCSLERSTVHRRRHIIRRSTDTSSKTCAHLLHGLTILHTALAARWNLVQVLHSAWPETVAKMYPEPNILVPDLTKEPSQDPAEPKIQLDVAMNLLGPRAMHHVVFLETWTGPLDRPVVKDILESLGNEVQKRSYVTSHGGSAETISLDGFNTLDGLVTCICFLAWRPQWFRLEKYWSSLLPNHCNGNSITLALAVCCVPTLGILRLCWRAASHSHPSGGRVIENIGPQVLSGWDNSLQTSLQSDRVRFSPTCILKLLAFSVYLYTFGTPRSPNIAEDEKQAWAKIFSQFTASIQDINVPRRCNRPHCRHRTPWSALATVCLEMIRFEEILTRVFKLRGNREQPRPEQPHSSPRFD